MINVPTHQNHKLLTDEELKDLTNEISMKYFGEFFNHDITWNSRIRRAGGKYCYNDKVPFNVRNSSSIELSAKHHREFGLEHTIQVIKHELAHHHLRVTNQPFDDGEKRFEETLERIGALPSCNSLSPRYFYECPSCSTISKSYNRERFYCKSCSDLKNYNYAMMDYISHDRYKELYNKKIEEQL